MPWDISVKALVDTKKAEEVGWYLRLGGVSLALPEEGWEVVCFAENSTLPDVKSLGEHI